MCRYWLWMLTIAHDKNSCVGLSFAILNFLFFQIMFPYQGSPSQNDQFWLVGHKPHIVIYRKLLFWFYTPVLFCSLWCSNLSNTSPSLCELYVCLILTKTASSLLQVFRLDFFSSLTKYIFARVIVKLFDQYRPTRDSSLHERSVCLYKLQYVIIWLQIMDVLFIAGISF